MSRRLSRRAFMAAAAGSFGAEIAWGKAASGGATIVSVADYGVRPGSEDAGPGVQTALSNLPKTGGATLLFPAGVYRFAADTDIALRIAGVENLAIEGQGATLNFSGRTRPFVVNDCAGLTIHGIAVDWRRPPFSQGEVVAVAPDRCAIDVRVDPEFPVDGSEPVRAITTHERATGLIAIQGIDAYNPVKQATLAGPQLLRLTLNWAMPFHVGDVVVIRHQVYGSNVFRLTNCKNVVVRDVKVYAAPGMALLVVGCNDIVVERLRIEPTPGTTRLMSTCADGMHFAGCRGSIDIRDCELRAMGDDCINVHGTFLTVVEHRDARTLLVDRPDHRPFSNDDLPPKGEHFSVVDRGSLHSFGARAIVGAEPGRYEKLLFAGDLPAEVRAGDLVYDADEAPQVTISHCRFPGNRARGILAHRNTLIEHCTFANQSHQAILMLSAANLPEGPTIRNVTIAHNDIRGTGRLGLPGGAIRVAGLSVGEDDSVRFAPEPANRTVRIVGNMIVNASPSAIEVGETSDVTIAANRIELRDGQALVLRNVRNATVTGNTCAPRAPAVVTDSPQGEVTFADNTGLIRDR